MTSVFPVEKIVALMESVNIIVWSLEDAVGTQPISAPIIQAVITAKASL